MGPILVRELRLVSSGLVRELRLVSTLVRELRLVSTLVRELRLVSRAGPEEDGAHSSYSYNGL